MVRGLSTRSGTDGFSLEIRDSILDERHGSTFRPDAVEVNSAKLSSMSLILRSALAVGTLTLAVATTARVVAQNVPIDLRPGEWQVTVLGMTMPPAALAKIPAAARANIEAEMKKPTTTTTCITAKDIAELNLGKMDDDEDCRVTQRTTSRTAATFTRECTGDNKRTDTMTVDAASRESFKASVKMTTEDGPSSVTMTGKWLAAVCKAD